MLTGDIQIRVRYADRRTYTSPTFDNSSIRPASAFA
jgi:hypothetical protein